MDQLHRKGIEEYSESNLTPKIIKSCTVLCSTLEFQQTKLRRTKATEIFLIPYNPSRNSIRWKLWAHEEDWQRETYQVVKQVSVIQEQRWSVNDAHTIESRKDYVMLEGDKK